ncbi:MAG: Ppx/GppA family phosphatase [Nitrososphaerota archaeon]|jgi:exopolyphosphatase/guanosine-5'-triphosphate,3'-diphosphate pyrophosphatase|uniref:Ppx/GppA phosphatase family protein n=1 Tax=Candidatus Bathycorpusculum sp. TaxID=2994959 RepID=UPI00283234D6|nr:Ppx/GppA family phosphatase [Candidatus Termitimicrobium sp.]MCL2431087.1 Ppx/GppA family phosphatase [Candidatus Termitimicrobium sp.]MDR0492222.1 Ppx/GppA family phosphatase [Nitrososphaerota archaeon]
MESTVKTAETVVGFIDIGTNAIRLLVAKINPNFSYTTISREKEIVRLGEGEFNDQTLKPAAMERAILVCGKFADLARTYGAAEIISVGTSAIREATNQVEFLKKLKAKTGLTVRVISGEEEARLIWLGVSSGIDIDGKKAIFIDLGGGSTEIAIGSQHECFYVNSLRLGAIRLTAQFIGEGWANPIDFDLYKKIKHYACSQISVIKLHVLEYGVRIAWGSSGTIINLAEVANKLFKKANSNDTALVLTRKNLKKLAMVLCWLPLEERRRLPAINPERADIIVAGAAVIEAVMEKFGLEEIRISNRELRDGLLVEYLSTFEGFREFQKEPIRNQSILHLGRSCNFDEKHAETVAFLSIELFDSAKKIELHNLGAKERDLLRYAAFLHDVGDFLSFNDHHLHSYYIIRNAGLPGFDKTEIQMMANIAKFHRKKVPTKKALKTEGIDEKSKVISILSTFLRLAEKLDRNHCGLVKKAEFIKKDKDHVVLRFYSDSDCSLEEWSVIQNQTAFYGAFEKPLGVECVITNF